jgi:Ion channel
MTLVVATCALLVVLATVIHYEALRILGGLLPGLRVPSRMKLIAVLTGSFAAHVVEILLYAFAIYALTRWFDIGALGRDGVAPLEAVIYFSAETFTSLGYGDIVPHGPLRLLAGIEALNGLLLIGWSGSYIYVSMERFWKNPPD